MRRAWICGTSILTAALVAASPWVGASPARGLVALGDDDLAIAVGTCENGATKVSDGMACEKAAERCVQKKDAKVTIGISAEPFGVGVEFSVELDLPTGCDTDTHDRNECAPQEQYTTGEPGGEVTHIHKHPCDPKEGVERASCVDTPVASLTVPMPASLIAAAKKANQEMDKFLAALNKLPFGPKVHLPEGFGLSGFAVQGDKLVINLSGMKTCKKQDPTKYKCGSKKTNVKTCNK